MTWNQNAYEAYLNRPAKAVEERDPFVLAGSHTGIVVAIVPFEHKDHGPSVRVVMEYATSNSAQPGTTCVRLFNLFKKPKYETQTSDGDEFVDFVCKLQGVKLGQHHDAVRALLMTQAQGGQLEVQPARGSRVIFTGTETGKPNDKGNKFVKVAFFPCENDMATTARNRADLDQRRPLGAVLGAPAQQAQGGYQQAAQGGGYQQAPQSYGAPQGQQVAQGGPPAWNPQWGPQPAGYGMPVQPAPVMQPPPAFQQAAPQMPQGGGFGQYVQQPAPGQLMQQAPAAPGKPPWNPAWGPQPAGY